MAQRLDLPTPRPFNIDDNNNAFQRWEKWLNSLDYYMIASNITDTKQKRAVLLHLAGEDVQTIFETFSDTGEDFSTAVHNLTEYFRPQQNVSFERHTFRLAAQEPSETITTYVTRLRQLAKTCEFDKYSPDEAIKDQVIDRCSSPQLRRRLLRETGLDIDSMLRIAKSLEVSESQATQMEDSVQPTGNFTGNMEAINFISHSKQARHNTSRPRQPQSRAPTQSAQNTLRKMNKSCYGCGNTGHIHNDDCCPAKGKICDFCHKLNHFSSVCLTKLKQGEYSRKPTHNENVNLVNVSTPQPNNCVDVSYVFNCKNSSDILQPISVSIDGTPVRMIIDSGASVNLLDRETYNQLSKDGLHRQLTECKTQLFTYGAKQPLKTMGTFQACIKYNNNKLLETIIVADIDGPGSLLGRSTALQLGVLTLPPDPTINKISTFTDKIMSEFPDVFNGVGKLVDFQLPLHIDKTIKPVIQPQRRLPFHLRNKVDSKIKELLALDIIEPAPGPSSWISPLVAIPKANGDIRVCVDMRQANIAIQRTRYPIPTIEDSLQQLNGAVLFSKLDLKWGYHQIELTPDSRDITTFQTPDGLYRYKRLMFGVNSASEEYQHSISTALNGCENTQNISDDIIIFGRTPEEHNRCLCNTLRRLQEKGLTVNPDKCEFGVSELNFFGFKISAAGFSPEVSKVEAIKSFQAPTNPSEVRSFLGLANYVSRFIPQFATIADPLRQLTRKDIPWQWNSTHQQAFNQLKTAISSSSVMAHFNPKARTHLTVDASPVGLGAILTQTSADNNSKPIAYASRSLTAVERRYSQTEKEALAVVWACEKFHLYLYGQSFDLLSDQTTPCHIQSSRKTPSTHREMGPSFTTLQIQDTTHSRNQQPRRYIV